MTYIKPNRLHELLLIQPGAQVSGLTDDNFTVTVARVLEPLKTYPDNVSELRFEDTQGRCWFVNTKYSMVTVRAAPTPA
jgi:hypothetical protein